MRRPQALFYDDISDSKRTLSNISEGLISYVYAYDPDRYNICIRDVSDTTSDIGIEIAFSMEDLKCSICDSPVDLEGEGGIHGFFGVCEVAFCVWCYASIIDMVERNCFQCQENLHHEE